MSRSYAIGELSAMAGTGVPTIRYYERIGLMPTAPRTTGNQRRYDDGHVARLRFIRHARDLGFGQDSVRELLQLKDRPEQSCEAADALARRHLEAVDQRIAHLQALRQELQRMIDACAGGAVSDCRIIESLAEPAGRRAGGAADAE